MSEGLGKNWSGTLNKSVSFNTQVCRTIGDAEDKTNLVMRKLNQASTSATFSLTMRSYRGGLLLARCVKEEIVRPITDTHSLEQLELLAKANSGACPALPLCRLRPGGTSPPLQTCH